MAKLSDREFALHRKIKDLEEKNRQLEQKIAQLEKKRDREKPVDKRKPKPVTTGDCPDCGSTVTVTDLPFGKLKLCSKGCGWRDVRKS